MTSDPSSRVPIGPGSTDGREGTWARVGPEGPVRSSSHGVTGAPTGRSSPCGHCLGALERGGLVELTLLRWRGRLSGLGSRWDLVVEAQGSAAERRWAELIEEADKEGGHPRGHACLHRTTATHVVISRAPRERSRTWGPTPTGTRTHPSLTLSGGAMRSSPWWRSSCGARVGRHPVGS